MNASEPLPTSPLSIGAVSLDKDLLVIHGAQLIPAQNRLALTLEYKGEKALEFITVLFPGEPRTLYIRDVFSEFPGEVVTFRRPAPRVAEVALQAAVTASPERGTFEVILRVSSPLLQLPPGKTEAQGKVFVGVGTWPPRYRPKKQSDEAIDAELDKLAGPAQDEPPEITRAKRFFLEYDHVTHPLLLGTNKLLGDEDKAMRAALIQKCLPILQQRIRMRGYCALSSRNFEAAAGRDAGSKPPSIPTARDLGKVRLTLDEAGIDAPLQKAEVSYLSSIQRNVIERHYPEIRRGDWSQVRKAFEDFADGMFREGAAKQAKTRMGQASKASNGEPDSAHVFFFAEFACLAIEHGVDADFWEQLLPIFADIQPIYVNRYGSGAAEAVGSEGDKFDDTRFKKYGEGTFSTGSSRPGRRHGNRDREKVLTEIGENVSEAFRNSYSRSNPVAQAGSPLPSVPKV